MHFRRQCSLAWEAIESRKVRDAGDVSRATACTRVGTIGGKGWAAVRYARIRIAEGGDDVRWAGCLLSMKHREGNGRHCTLQSSPVSGIVAAVRFT